MKRHALPLALAAVALAALAAAAGLHASYIEGHAEDENRTPPPDDRRPVARPPARPHVPELADVLGRLRVGRPLRYRGLCVYPLTPAGETDLDGRWLTLDEATSKKLLVVNEKGGGGSVPVVMVHNKSPDHHVFLMAGELITGGKQTRTIRADTVLAPGQKVDIGVFCVERGRWSGNAGFSGGNAMVPQSIQKELRKKADQSRVWREVARNNKGVGVDSATESLEEAVKSGEVQKPLAAARKAIVPEVPEEAVGFVFARRNTPLGAEIFGRSDLAGELLPKLIDAYAVDVVLQMKEADAWDVERGVARRFLDRVRAAGSERAETPGSGAGIETRAAGLVGDGVGLGSALVHYGVQIEDRVVPENPKRGDQAPATQQQSPRR